MYFVALSKLVAYPSVRIFIEVPVYYVIILMKRTIDASLSIDQHLLRAAVVCLEDSVLEK